MMKRFWREEAGATAIEYGLIAAMFGVAIIGSLMLLRSEYDGMYSAIENGVVGASNP